MSEKFGSKSVNDKEDGLNVWRVVQVGCGGTPGMVTDDMEAL